MTFIQSGAFALYRDVPIPTAGTGPAPSGGDSPVGPTHQTGLDVLAEAANDFEGTQLSKRPFKCTWEKCEKAFARAGGLTKHTRKHTGERPFKCTWKKCGKAFADAGNLIRHTKTHIKLKGKVRSMTPPVTSTSVPSASEVLHSMRKELENAQATSVVETDDTDSASDKSKRYPCTWDN